MDMRARTRNGGTVVYSKQGSPTATTPFVIPGCAEGAGPESVLTIVVMDSGLALRAPRNDERRMRGAASINQPPVQRRQKTVVENLRRSRPLLELVVLSDLVDRLLEARRIDAAKAIAFDFGGQDV